MNLFAWQELVLQLHVATIRANIHLLHRGQPDAYTAWRMAYISTKWKVTASCSTKWWGLPKDIEGSSWKPKLLNRDMLTTLSAQVWPLQNDGGSHLLKLMSQVVAYRRDSGGNKKRWKNQVLEPAFFCSIIKQNIHHLLTFSFKSGPMAFWASTLHEEQKMFSVSSLLCVCWNFGHVRPMLHKNQRVAASLVSEMLTGFLLQRVWLSRLVRILEKSSGMQGLKEKWMIMAKLST